MLARARALLLDPCGVSVGHDTSRTFGHLYGDHHDCPASVRQAVSDGIGGAEEELLTPAWVTVQR